MADGMVVPIDVIYFGTAGLLGVAAAIVVGLALRESGYVRTFLLVGAVPAAAMAIAYVFMGMEWLTVTTEGREQSVARFIGYSAVLVAVSFIFRELLALSRRQFLAVTLVLLLTPWFALASWIPEGGPAETVLTVLTVVAFLSGAYLLFGPVTRIAAEVSGERRLMYAKLRNLFVLCWGVLILQSALSEQALGLTNLFVGQLGASYTDVIFTIGIAGLVLSGKTIYDQLGDGNSNEDLSQQPVAG